MPPLMRPPGMPPMMPPGYMTPMMPPMRPPGMPPMMPPEAMSPSMQPPAMPPLGFASVPLQPPSTAGDIFPYASASHGGFSLAANATPDASDAATASPYGQGIELGDEAASYWW